MLEDNTFRSFMLIGSVIVVAAVMTLFFTLPLVDITPDGKDTFENVMNVELDADTTTLTGYQTLMFSIKGKTRANTLHY